MKLLQIIKEIKQFPGTFPKEIELWDDEDVDKYPVLRDYRINRNEEAKIRAYMAHQQDGENILGELSGKTLWEIAQDMDPDFTIENFMHLITALFPTIKIKGAYN